jgi:hypothetical protein
VSSPRRRRPSIPPCSSSERNVHEAFRTGSPIQITGFAGSMWFVYLHIAWFSILDRSWGRVLPVRVAHDPGSYKDDLRADAGARARVGRSACGFKVRDDLLNLPLLLKGSIGWV